MNATKVADKINETLARYQESIDGLTAVRDWISNHQNLLEEIGIAPSKAISWTMSVDFDDPTREEAVQLMMRLGGKWKKEVNGTHIDYSQRVDGVLVRLYKAPPPPSCKIVRTKHIVPATPEQEVERVTLDCTGGLE